MFINSRTLMLTKAGIVLDFAFLDGLFCEPGEASERRMNDAYKPIGATPCEFKSSASWPIARGWL